MLSFIEPVEPFEDLDGDQLPDPWEVQYFGATNVTDDATFDSDGDGLSNGEEYIADTDPDDGGDIPVLMIESTSDATVSQLMFDTSDQRMYHIDFRSSVETGSWSTAVFEFLGAGGMMTIPRTNAVEAIGYYRLGVELP